MNAKEFCLWLKGALEINDELTEFSAKQAAIIISRLSGVIDGSYSSVITEKEGQFCSWLDGVFDVTDVSQGIKAPLVTKIRTRFAEVSAEPLVSRRTRVQGLERRDEDGGLVAMC